MRAREARISSANAFLDFCEKNIRFGINSKLQFGRLYHEKKNSTCIDYWKLEIFDARLCGDTVVRGFFIVS